MDANVLVAANGKAPQAGAQCAASAAQALLALQQGGPLLEDAAGEAFIEYKRYCSFSGQPGAGDRFFQWFMQNRYVADRVRQIDTSSVNLHADLLPMDKSDHKWLKIYLADGASELLNATDSDYEEHAAALKGHGIHVVELCLGRPQRAPKTAK